MPVTIADIQRKFGDTIEPLYKEQMWEPYMENEQGQGYQGVVLFDKAKNKLMCNECGEFVEDLSHHVKLHKLSTREYREKYGLNLTQALIIPELSKIRSKSAEIRMKNRDRSKDYGKRLNNSRLKKPSLTASRQMQYLNRFGLCPAQIKKRLNIVKWRVALNKGKGANLSTTDVVNYDKNLSKHLEKKYGSLSKAFIQLGYDVCYIKSKPVSPDEGIIAMLREFVKRNSKIPTYKEAKKFANDEFPPSAYSIVERFFIRRFFGSWERAKMMAGLDQLLAEVKNDN